MKYPKRSQYKYAKSRYRVRNWSEYEASLQRRGEIVASDLTGRRTPDCARAPVLLEQIDDPVVSVYGDGHYSVVRGDWHYIRYVEGGEELYNLAVDPHEWDNLAGAADHANRISDMASFIPEQRAPLVQTKSIRWQHVLDGTGDLYDPGR